MRTLALMLLVSFVISCNTNKTVETTGQPIVLKEKTVSVDDSTNAKISLVFDHYEALHNGLVEYQTSAVDSAAMQITTVLTGFSAVGIKDSILADSVQHYAYRLLEQAKQIKAKATIDEKKRSFSVLSEALYAMLSAVQFSDHIVYKQTCPMAFNDTESASWVSASAEINNPYLGKKHSRYGNGMLHCGDVKDSVAYKK